MEEADLLKERLQAITDKRRIQEDIARRKREIEEEKLKLQYLKKKSLRDQWLMDGVHPQSQQEQEAIKLQALDGQLQTKLLQSNIDRIEEQIKVLESQETLISTNEAHILKRLKEVEKTAEYIIKAKNADRPPDPVQYVYSAIPDIPKSYKPMKAMKLPTPDLEADNEHPKQALFSMEINVQKDVKTGLSEVVSVNTVTPQDVQHKGTKVYDDGRKSVHAVHPGGEGDENRDELSPMEVEELLRKATEKRDDCDIQYHEPVFSSPYNRPSTPKRQDWGASSPEFKIHSDFQRSLLEVTKKASSLKDEQYEYPSPQIPNVEPQNRLSSCRRDLLQTSSQECRNGRQSPYLASKVPHNIPEDKGSSKPFTMIFMGYQNAEDDDEAESVIQAELVLISDNNDEPHKQDSYHPPRR